MKCKYHVEREASYICQKCNQPICSECHLSINGENICKNCIENGSAKPREGKLKVIFHFICSLIPGAGQMQQGAMRRGVQIMLTFFGFVILAGVLHLDELLFLGVVIWFYSFFDSYHIKKAKFLHIEGWDKEFIKPEYLDQIITNKESKWVGWLLVALGGFAILNIFFNIGRMFIDYQIFRALQDSILPVLAIILGWNILKKSKKLTEKTEEIEEQKAESSELIEATEVTVSQEKV
ncbi:MAG: B-box zinc finger protein [Peptococcales bacterium]|jgi:hypothetical protein